MSFIYDILYFYLNKNVHYALFIDAYPMTVVVKMYMVSRLFRLKVIKFEIEIS